MAPVSFAYGIPLHYDGRAIKGRHERNAIHFEELRAPLTKVVLNVIATPISGMLLFEASF